MKKYIKYMTALFTILIFLFTLSLNKNVNNKNLSINDNNMLIHYIDVTQGDCILIQVNGKNLLIDAGPKDSKKALLNYLDSLNLTHLDYVIATHPHEDHIGNMAKIIRKYDIINFYAPKIESSTTTFEKMVEALQYKNLKINILKKGVNSIDLGKNTRLTVFSPTSNLYENINNYSPVIKIEYGNTSFLFTGDAEKEIENELLKEDNLKCDVIKIAHHGSSSSTSESFISKVNPSIAIISVGNYNKYNHPNKEIVSRLKEKDISIYQTNKNGTIILCSNGSIIKKL